MFPKVVQVVPYADYTVDVYFEDGKLVRYDAKQLLAKPVFAPLQDACFFMDACTVMNDTLAWDVSGKRDETTCLDIDPETLYELEQVTERIA